MCVFDEWVIRSWWTKSHRVLSCPLTGQFCIFILELNILSNLNKKYFHLPNEITSDVININSIYRKIVRFRSIFHYDFSIMRFTRVYNHLHLPYLFWISLRFPEPVDHPDSDHTKENKWTATLKTRRKNIWKMNVYDIAGIRIYVL